MFRLEIVNGSLQVSFNGAIILVAPKESCAIDVLALYASMPFVNIYNKYLGTGTVIFNKPLADCEDDTGTPFDVNSFIAFAEANLGFYGIQNVEEIIRSKSNGTFGSHTGDTAETVIHVIDINPNEFEYGDWMTLLFSCEKNATVGNISWRLRAGINGNTSDGAIALASASTANSRYVSLYRIRPQFLTGNQLRIWSAGSASFSDIGQSGNPTLLSLNPTSSWKLTLTAQLTVSAEIASLTGYIIGKIKSF